MKTLIFFGSVSNVLIHKAGICASGRVRGDKKHEIYASTFGDHLFYDLFLQGRGRHGPLGPPPASATLFHMIQSVFMKSLKYNL